MEITKEEIKELQDKIKKLENRRFLQQRLPAWRPKPTVETTVTLFGFFGILFLIIGIMLLASSEAI